MTFFTLIQDPLGAITDPNWRIFLSVCLGSICIPPTIGDIGRMVCKVPTLNEMPEGAQGLFTYQRRHNGIATKANIH